MHINVGTFPEFGFWFDRFVMMLLVSEKNVVFPWPNTKHPKSMVCELLIVFVLGY